MRRHLRGDFMAEHYHELSSRVNVLWRGILVVLLDFLVWGGGGGGVGMDVVGDGLLVEHALVEDDGMDRVKGCDVEGGE
nr:hypothetical protein [Tanacetum cinerariifolium]